MARLLLRDLTPGTTYKVQLRAAGGDSVSEWSRLFDLPTTTDTTAPDVPAWAASDWWVVNGDTFVATWQALNFALEQNVDFDHYELELDDGVSQTVLRTNNTSYTLTYENNRIFFGTPKATVLARVRSVDAVGNVSAWSSQETATNPAPSPASSITVTDLYDAIDVKWDGGTLPDDFKAFVLQVSTTSSSTGFSTIYAGPNSQFQHATIMFATDHWFRVYLQDKFGTLSTAVTSGAVRPKSAFGSDTTPPDNATSLVSSPAFDATRQRSYATLAWTASATPADVAEYEVRYSTDASNWQYVKAPSDATGMRIDNLTPGASYYIGIRAVDAAANKSAWLNSTVYPITATADSSAPSTPQAPTVSSSTQRIQVTQASLQSDGVTAMESDVDYYEVHASTTTGFTESASTMIGTIKSGPAQVAAFNISASAASGSTETWYVKTFAVDYSGNKSGASAQATSTPGLIDTLNIVDLAVTNAKITNLNADKIEAGSGIINDLVIKSELTIGASGDSGAIKSYDYVTSAGATGFYLSDTGLIIKTGAVEAAALKIQAGSNLMPAKYASFEHSLDVYNGVDYGVYTFNDVRVLADAKFGGQVKRNGWVGAAPGTVSEIWMGTSATDYNIDVEPSTTYIISAYVMKETGTPSAELYMKGNGSGTVTAVTGASLSPITSTTAWTRIYGTWTSGASDTKAVLFSRSDASVDGAYFIDGIQVEKQIGSAITPSQWSAPGSTSIDGGMVRTGSITSTALAKDYNAVDMSGLPAWSINTSGAAQFGDVLVRGRLIIGVTGDYENSITSATDTDGNEYVYEDTSKLTGIGTMQSYNYRPGESGWSIRSNGYAEFLQLKANSISSDAISAVSPDKLNPGTMTADLIIGTAIRSVEKDTLYVANKARLGSVVTLTMATPHTRLVGDRVQVKLDTPDANIDTPGKVFATITAIDGVNNLWFSYTHPSGGSVTVASAPATGTVYVEGRSVVMSPDGVTLFQNDGIQRIIDLPTDTLLPAYFAGDVEANSLTVRDDFLLQGTDNAIAAGGVFTLNASVVAPSGTPTLNFSWDYVSTWMNNDYTVWKSGLYYEGGGPNRYITTNAFFGAGMLGTNPDGSFNFNVGAADDAAPNNDGHVPFGMTKLGGKFYVLVNDSGDGLWKIRRYAAVGSGFSNLELTVTYNRASSMGATATEWKVDGWNGSALKDPIIGSDATYIYIARCAKNGKIWVAKYDANLAFVSEVATNITDNQNLKGLNVGTFDFSGDRYVISTEGNSAKTSMNYVTSTAGTHQTTESFPSPNNAKIWGVAHNGTAFVTLGQNNRLYTHTSLANTGTNVWYAKAAWFDGNNSRTIPITARSGNGTTTTLTVASGHGFVAGDIIYVAGTGGGTNLDNQYFTLTSTTATTLVFSSAYSGSGAAVGTVTNEWETALGAYASFTATRRAKMTATAGTLPVGAGSNIPDRVRFYFSNVSGGAGTYYRQDNTLTGNQQTFTADPLFSGSTAPLTAFPAGTPAVFKSNNGLMEISADGYALFGSTTDVTATAGNTPALRIGDPAGSHLRADGNEIQSMAGDTTTGGLSLNREGGGITLGNGSQSFTRLRRGSTSVTASGGTGTDTISHGGDTAPDMVVATSKSSGTDTSVEVGSYTASTFTVTMRRMDGTTNAGAVLPNGSTKTIEWIALWF